MPDGIGREFIKQTKYQFLGPSDQYMGLPQPPLELPYSEDAGILSLSSPAEITTPAVELRQAVEQRVSVRQYTTDPLSMDELSFLLWSTQGVKEVSGRPVTMRTVPSAGARHAFETYLLVNRVTSMEPGLYRYLAIEHKLLPLSHTADLADRLTHACWRQAMVKNSAVTFFWAAVTCRMAWRYGERGYRYLFLDAGHVCQNLYLAAEAVGCGVCAIAAFDDDLLNQTLDIDGVEQFAVYVATTGKKIPSK